MSKMLAAMHAARQTYGGAARKRDSVGGGIYRALHKIGSDIEVKSASEKAEKGAESEMFKGLDINKIVKSRYEESMTPKKPISITNMLTDEMKAKEEDWINQLTPRK